MSDNDIIIKKFSDFENSDSPYIKETIPILLGVADIKKDDPSTHTELNVLKFLNSLLDGKFYENENPQVVYIERFCVYGKDPFKKHYFIFCKASSRVIDVLNWISETPIGYQDIHDLDDEKVSIINNPYDPNTYSTDNTPLVLWLAVRGVFVGRMERKPRESVDNFITRVFRKHKLDYGLSRKEAVGKAYAIAISSLQKKKYLKQGRRVASSLGLRRGDEILDQYNKKDLDRYFLEFETMLKLSEGNRYAK